jgi:hypothetical protein
LSHAYCSAPVSKVHGRHVLILEAHRFACLNCLGERLGDLNESRVVQQDHRIIDGNELHADVGRPKPSAPGAVPIPAGHGDARVDPFAGERAFRHFPVWALAARRSACRRHRGADAQAEKFVGPEG